VRSPTGSHFTTAKLRIIRAKLRVIKAKLGGDKEMRKREARAC
jgi:hypothetical protein